VNAIAIMYVNDHLESLRSEAEQYRVASLAERRSLRDRLASAAADLRRVLAGEPDGHVLPKLESYPYGG
jgi:predicted trehalose synthase